MPYSRKRFNKLVIRYKSTFSKVQMFGVPISELSPNELRACICVLGANEKRARENRAVSDRISPHSSCRDSEYGVFMRKGE
jgi:hypothetical protein